MAQRVLDIQIIYSTSYKNPFFRKLISASSQCQLWPFVIIMQGGGSFVCFSNNFSFQLFSFSITKGALLVYYCSFSVVVRARFFLSFCYCFSDRDQIVSGLMWVQTFGKSYQQTIQTAQRILCTNSNIFSNDAYEESDKYDSRHMRRSHGYGCSFVVAASIQPWNKGAGP